jgi:hypothetical protein
MNKQRMMEMLYLVATGATAVAALLVLGLLIITFAAVVL